MAGWDDLPTVLVFGDTEAGMSAAARSATAVGGRIRAAVDLAEAHDRLDGQVTADLIVVDIARRSDPLLDSLLRRLNAEAGAGRPSIVSVAAEPELIDTAFARLVHQDTMLLVGPAAYERTSAVVEMLARPRGFFDDVKNDGGSGNLQQLSEEVDRIARTLAALSDRGAGETRLRETAPPPLVSAAAKEAEPPDPAAIRGIIRARRLRDQFLGSDLFADPAWDMLLDLKASQLERRPVAVSSLCIAAAVPATTALRWIKQLTDGGMFRRVADPLDGRRIFIELTEAAADGMAAYLGAIGRLNLHAI